MDEVRVKTHLIITDITEYYHINWCGKIMDTKPKVQNGLPVFVIIGSLGRVELNTVDMHEIEECAKRLTEPRGRAAQTSDVAHIYIKEIDGKETLMGTVIHRRVKSYAPMFDKVGYKS